MLTKPDDRNFVMEYVKGKSITEYADHRRLSIPERLELFEQVCQAVQHAHHKGVIHRDLKPRNVLVCTQDGKPFSKVIDFGVAKEAQRKLAEAAMLAEAKQRELAERQLIDGLLRPIGYGDEPNTAELRSFVDWSQIPDARLKLRVLDVAFENPEVSLRLARRAERAMQASIGLSPTRRSKAIELMSAKQRDMQADPRIRTVAAWLALELGSADLPRVAGSPDLAERPNRCGSRRRSPTRVHRTH